MLYLPSPTVNGCLFIIRIEELPKTVDFDIIDLRKVSSMYKKIKTMYTEEELTDYYENGAPEYYEWSKLVIAYYLLLQRLGAPIPVFNSIQELKSGSITQYHR